jgi:hypothetical protein
LLSDFDSLELAVESLFASPDFVVALSPPLRA